MSEGREVVNTKFELERTNLAGARSDCSLGVSQEQPDKHDRQNDLCYRLGRK